MANRTLWVSGDDLLVWDKAAEVWKGKLSRKVAQFLREELAASKNEFCDRFDCDVFQAHTHAHAKPDVTP